MIGIILLQKGEEVSSSQSGPYNAGSSGRGSKNILTRVTAILATLFFCNCLFLANLVRKESRLETIVPKKESAPVTIKPLQKK